MTSSLGGTGPAPLYLRSCCLANEVATILRQIFPTYSSTQRPVKNSALAKIKQKRAELNAAL
jgi:hypothetical protein